MTRGDLDLIISGLVKLRREVDLALDRAVLTGRAEHDLSWDEVAALTGVTARTAAKRWGDGRPAPKNGTVRRTAAALEERRGRWPQGPEGAAGRTKAGATTRG